MQQFDTASPVDLTVRNRSGWIEVTTHTSPTTEVDLVPLNAEAEDLVRRTRIDATPTDTGHRVVVEVPEPDSSWVWLGRGSGIGLRWGSGWGVGVRVRVPEESRLHIQAASADVRAEGRCGATRIHTASGDVTLALVTEAEVETASGEVRVEQVAGSLRAYTASGDIQIRQAGGPVHLRSASGSQTVMAVDGDAECESASGDIHVGHVRGHLSARAASGDIVVRESHGGLSLQSQSGDLEARLVHQGRVTAEAISGDVTVGIAQGSRLAVNAHTRSGDLTSEISLHDDPAGEERAGPLVELRAHTISGDVRIVRAHTASAV